MENDDGTLKKGFFTIIAIRNCFLLGLLGLKMSSFEYSECCKASGKWVSG